MMSGKAVSRAHFLVDAALVNKLLMAVVPCQHEHVILNPTDMDTITHGGEMETSSHLAVEDKLSASEVEKIHDLFETNLYHCLMSVNQKN